VQVEEGEDDMKTMNLMGMVAIAGLMTAGCASTQMTSTWTDPAARGMAMTRVVVVALTPDEGIRRMAEDEVAHSIKSAEVVPSYLALGGTDLAATKAVKAKLREGGYQGVLVIRVASVKEQPVVTAGPYMTFDGYYDYAAGTAMVEMDTTIKVVSNLYSLDGNKLVWSGVSSTFDPSSLRQMVGDVAHAVAKDLEKNHLIA
jgi:hypothetical protein